MISPHVTVFRVNAFLEFCKDKTGENFEAFIRELIKRSGLDIVEAKRLSDEDAALLVIGADLTYNQFDILCKWGVLSDDSLKSWRKLDAGFKKVAQGLPEIMWLLGKCPGACMDPVEYNNRALDICYDKLQFNDTLREAILVVRSGDGMSEGRGYPVYMETHNYPQDPSSQSTDGCHLTGLGRIVESNAAEKMHLMAYYNRWKKVKEYKGKKIKQIIVGDQPDKCKKEGTAGTSSRCWCSDCFVDKSCLNQVSWRAEESVKQKMSERRVLLRPGCEAAGQCICPKQNCSYYLAKKLSDWAFSQYSKWKLKEDEWPDPFDVKHPKHQLILDHAMDECLGQVHVTFCHDVC